MGKAKAVLQLIGRIFAGIFGHWRPPGWLRAIGRGLQRTAGWARRRKLIASIGLLLFAGLGVGGYYGYQAYKNRPKPVTIAVEVHAPELTPIRRGAKPRPVVLTFDAAVAPLSAIKKDVTKGVILSPKRAGTWRWATEKKLVFEPVADWPVAGEFTVELAEKGLTTDSVLLSDYRLEFKTAPFEAQLASQQFYKDPVQASEKKIVASFTFTHPVDSASFEKQLKLRFMPTDREQAARDLSFTVTYDKLKGQAHVHSERIEIPRKDAYVQIALAEGVKALVGGPGSKRALSGKVRVPGLYNFFRITRVEPRVVENERMEPEHVLSVESSVGVTESEFGEATRAWILPRFHPNQKRHIQPYRWYDPTQVSESVLKSAERLKLRQLPAAREYDTFQSFRFVAEPGRYLYLQVKEGTRAHGGYVLGKTDQRIVRVPDFPKQVKLLHSGSLLSLSGKRRITVFTRDVPGLRIEIARFLPGQLHHFVSNSSGDFSNPRFYYRVGPQHLADFKVETRTISARPGKPVYESIDLTPYLASTQGHRGLFLVKVNGWDTKRRGYAGPSDQRLILVSDLGLFVKRQTDGSQMLFVQSIHTGQPVGGATVQVLGRNGLPVARQVTDAQGSVNLPNLDRLNRERQPTLYVVSKGKDWSFLPWDRRDRQLDVSRFDVGGVSESSRGDELSAYLFSDRGIYRPGERMQIGYIVRRQDWAATYEGLPLVATIVDPRGMEIKRLPITLHASGFGDLSYQTRESSPTGKYTVVLSTARRGAPYSRLGAVRVTVREFLPDRMKIRVQLSGQQRVGWLHPKGIKAQVTLSNLYGTPATDRRIRGKLTLQPAMPRFPAYREFTFFDPLRPKGRIEEALEEDTTDDKGQHSFDLNLQRFHRATYRLSVLAEGFEGEGGRSVTAEASAYVSPLPYLVGYKADGELQPIYRGTPRQVRVVAVDPQGKGIAVGELTAALVERKVISVLTRLPNGTYGYRSVTRESERKRKAFAIADKGTIYRLPTQHAGDFVIVLRDKADTVLQRIPFAVAASANVTREMEKSSQLKLSLIKSSVEPGDALQVQIKAPYPGAGLITIERDRVYAHKWFKTATNSTVQTIRVPKGLEIGGYVSVAMVRAADSDEVFISPLTHGVVPFFISRDRRKVTLRIERPELVRPGRALKVKLRADRPARAVLIAIDEGILRVAKHATPDPLEYFLQKRSLGVSTRQLLDLILPEHDQLLNKSAAGGGDDETRALISANLNPFKRRRDKPAVFWSGIVEVGSEAKEISYTVPDSFNGSLRLMAVAASDTAVGSAAESTLVRGHFVVSPMTPVVVAPGDTFQVPVTIANNVEGSGAGAQVAVRLKTSKHLALQGSPTQQLAIAEMREGRIQYTLQALKRLGSARLTFEVSLGKKRARRSVELSVRPAAAYATALTVGYLPAKQRKKLAVPRRLYAEHRKLEAGVGPLPLTLAYGLRSYLKAFPHGCTEQLVSRAMPALILGKHPGFGFDAQEAHHSVSGFIDQVWSRQNSSGGFGKWVANPAADKLASVYAMHALTEAAERGYHVPQPLQRRGLQYLHRISAGAAGNDLFGQRLRAWAIYVLTRNEVVTTRYLVAAAKNLKANFPKTWKGDIASAYLAASHRLLKSEETAQQLIAGQRLGVGHAADYAAYYDSLVHDGHLLYLIAKHFPEQAVRVGPRQLESMIKSIAEGQYNTFSSAWAILGLEAYAKRAGAQQSLAAMSIVQLVGNKQVALKLPSGLIGSAPFGADARALLFDNQSDFGAYYTFVQQGYDRAPQQKEVAQGIEVFRELLDGGGKPTTTVRVGDELKVQLRIRAQKSYQGNLAIVDLLPGGFEVVTSAGSARQSDDEDEDRRSTALPFALPDSSYRPSYGDMREDRVVLYGGIGPAAKTFVYKIKATNTGQYVVPAIFAKSLYDPQVFAYGKASTVTIEKR